MVWSARKDYGSTYRTESATLATHLIKQAPGKMARSVFCGPEDGTRNLRDPHPDKGKSKQTYHVNLLKS